MGDPFKVFTDEWLHGGHKLLLLLRDISLVRWSVRLFICLCWEFERSHHAKDGRKAH